MIPPARRKPDCERCRDAGTVRAGAHIDLCLLCVERAEIEWRLAQARERQERAA